jgi:hypothetical protein
MDWAPRILRRARGTAELIQGKAQAEVNWLARAVDLYLDRVRHPEITFYQIDVRGFNARFPVARRRRVGICVSRVLNQADNLNYFRNLGRYGWRHRDLPRGVPVLQDLHPPNVAVLDYLSRYVAQPREQVLLDLACGLGILLLYERQLGFPRIHGYDNWHQLGRSTAEAFLNGFGLRGCLLEEVSQLATIDPTIVTCVGFPWDWLAESRDIVKLNSVNRVIVDRHYGPTRLPGFRRAAEYSGLVSVFERL